MARHGENIRKRKDGRWEGRFAVYSEERKRTVYQSVYGHTYPEVRARLSAQKSLAQEGAAVKKQPCQAQIRFGDVAQEWLESVKGRRKFSTYIKYNAVYHTHIQPLFEETALSDLTYACVSGRIPSTLLESMQTSIYCILNRILKFAAIQYAVTVPPLKKPALEPVKKPVSVLARSEQQKLASVLYREMDRFKLAVLLSLLMGLRLGELCALKWSDIDFENKILSVARTVQRLPVEGQKTRTALVESVPKSACSHREIPLPDSVIALFEPFQDGREYIFGGDKPLEPRTLQYRYKKLLNAAGVEDKNFHILRHTFATNCVEGGMDVKSLSEILGHADVQMTLRRYVHPSMETKRQGMARLHERIWGQIHGQAG